MVIKFRMRNSAMSGVTGDQERIAALLDLGLSRREIAERLAMSPAVVGRQISRLREKVRCGTYVPPPLPLETGMHLGTPAA
ncbi:MAG TPA: hypothetical protein VGE93_23145 [Bryobacteraceae bacterium]